VFNGGTVSTPLAVDPTDNTLTALTITMPTGAAANFTDWVNVLSETVGSRFEADAAGNFLVDARPAGKFQVTDSSGQTAFLVDASLVLVGNSGRAAIVAGSSVRVGSGGGTLGFYSGGPVTQPDVTGAKLPSDTVMASLLAGLAALGLITDSTA
jgi:hypothetical protein